jgi:Pyruvate/2-oxoacid:ferredoxin oxidoreductase gamma subunit
VCLRRVANVVMMGALLEQTECLSPDTAMKVLETKVKNEALLEVDRKALDAGRLYIDHTLAIGAVSQADGFGS